MDSIRIISRKAAADAAIQKKIYGSGHLLELALRTITLIIPNEEMEDTMKIVKSLKESELLIKEINKTIENEEKEQKWGKCYEKH